MELRAEFSAEQVARLLAPFPPESFLIGLTSIHWREAWKYGERAFRYCNHDVGHAIGTARIAAATLGWKMALSGWSGPRDGGDAVGDRSHGGLYLKRSWSIRIVWLWSGHLGT